jgi:antitoxin PrlF
MNMHSRIDEETVVNMTSKGQVLMPKAIRDRIGLVPGQPVRIGINDRGEAVVLPATLPVEETPDERRARIKASIMSVAGTMNTGFATTDEYMDFIRPHRLEPE